MGLSCVVGWKGTDVVFSCLVYYQDEDHEGKSWGSEVHEGHVSETETAAERLEECENED